MSTATLSEYRKRYVRTSAMGIAPFFCLKFIKGFIINFYLDESGDLGWVFDKPYRQGGSSRFLTISTLVIHEAIKLKSKRIIRKLHKKFKIPARYEIKWSQLNKKQRLVFAQMAKGLVLSEPNDVKYFSIIVNKANVMAHIREDSNKLYNYMIGLSLLPEMASCESVLFKPDPRSISVESGNSLHDYLKMKLWFEHKTKTYLVTKSVDSADSENIQFADLLSGLVQSHFEDRKSEPWNILGNHIYLKKLYFGS